MPITNAGSLPAHKTKHQTGGADEVSIAALAGSPAQKAAASGLASLDATSKVVQDPSTSFIPLAQKAAASGVASLSAGSLVVQKPADRLSKANFEITLNKLLGGAGAGADPTEIEASGFIGIKVVRKTADEIVNNSSILQNDDHLFFAMAANEVWEISLILHIYGSAAADIKSTIVMPAAGIFNGMIVGFDAAMTLAVTLVTNGDAITNGATPTNRISIIYQGLLINGANAGNMQFQWAQGVATVADTKVLANSCIILHKLV